MRPLLTPYMRKSSGEDPQGSRDRQWRAISAWAERNDVSLAEPVWEPHVSGKTHWRARGLGAAIERCARGEASGIVVEELSRLTRGNQLQVAELWDAMEQTGTRLVCIREGVDTAQGDHEFSFGLHALIARQQWKQARERVEGAKRRAVEDLGIHVGPAPFGYVRGPHEPLALDEPKAKAVRAAFELRASGASYGDVVRLLDERAPGGPSGRGAWNRNTVTRLLKNRAYLGEARGGDGYVRAGAHPAIVDAETFAAVAALGKFNGGGAPERRPRSLLAGLARCGACGGALERNTVGGGYLVYRCRGRSARGICTASAMAMANKLEALVDEKVHERLAHVAIGATFERGKDDERVSELHAQLAAARAKRGPFEDPEYVAALGLEAAKRALRRVDAEVETLGEELAERLTRQRPTPIGHLGELLGMSDPVDAGALFDELRNLYDLDDPVSRAFYVEQMRNVLGAFIDSVIVSRALRGTPLAERVEIVWKGKATPELR